jgi:hypothetical protein
MVARMRLNVTAYMYFLFCFLIMNCSLVVKDAGTEVLALYEATEHIYKPEQPSSCQTNGKGD